MTLLDSLGEWLMWVGGALAAVLTTGGTVVKRNRDRSRKNERQLEGDPNDPNVEGVLEIAYDTRERLEDFRSETRREHKQVMDRLEELDDD